MLNNRKIPSHMSVGAIVRGIFSLRSYILPFIPYLLVCLGITVVIADLNVGITSFSNSALTSLTTHQLESFFNSQAQTSKEQDAKAGNQTNLTTATNSYSAKIFSRFIEDNNLLFYGAAIIFLNLSAAVLTVMNSKIRARINNKMRWKIQEFLIKGLDREDGMSRRQRSLGKSWDALVSDSSLLGNSVVSTGMSIIQNFIMFSTYALSLFSLPGGWAVLILLLFVGLFGSGLVEWSFLPKTARLRHDMETLREEANTVGIRFFNNLDSLVALRGCLGAGQQVLSKVRQQGLASEKLILLNEVKSQILIFLGYLSLPVIFFVAASGKLKAGDVFQVYLLSGFIMASLKSLTATPSMLQQMAPGLERLTRILNIPAPGTRPKQIDVLAHQGNGGVSIVVERLNFCYPHTEKMLLNEVSFSIEKGETVLFVGRPGCGKSSMARLLAFEWKPVSGKIYIEETDVTNWNQYWGREVVGYLHDKPGWMEGTVLENISFGDDEITEDKIKDLIEKARIADLINNIANGGLEAYLKEPEKMLSSGEQKLVACLRLLARQVPVLIFDEPDANLAYSWVSRVSETIEKCRGNRTTIIITHRPQCFMADKVLFFHEGRIMAEGSHQELLSSQPLYAELVTHKISESNHN